MIGTTVKKELIEQLSKMLVEEEHIFVWWFAWEHVSVSGL